jgi:hypothetical protein
MEWHKTCIFRGNVLHQLSAPVVASPLSTWV